MKTSISLVTTVLNDVDGVAKFLANMRTQTTMPDEIVVVDGGSVDGTWEALQAAAMGHASPHLICLRECGCNVARGRNLAVLKASHDFVVSTDVGCDWDQRWLEELVAPIVADPEIELVVGSWGVRSSELVGPWALTEWALRAEFLECRARPDSQITTRSVAFRKGIWLRLGGLPEDLTLAADDLVFDKLVKATGVRTGSASQIRCYWHRHTTLRGFRKETCRYFYGNGEAGVTLRHPILVGGRMAIETILLVCGIGAIFYPSVRVYAIGCLVVVALSAVGRVLRWLPAARRLRELHVNSPLGRVILFDMLGRVDSIQSYTLGWFHGMMHCRNCRARLRVAGAH